MLIAVILFATLSIFFSMLSLYFYQNLQTTRFQRDTARLISVELNQQAAMRITEQRSQIEKLAAENQRLKNVSGCSMFGLCGYGFSQN